MHFLACTGVAERQCWGCGQGGGAERWEIGQSEHRRETKPERNKKMNKKTGTRFQAFGGQIEEYRTGEVQDTGLS